MMKLFGEPKSFLACVAALVACLASSVAMAADTGNIFPTTLGGASAAPATGFSNGACNAGMTNVQQILSAITGRGANGAAGAQPSGTPSSSANSCRAPDPDKLPKIPDSCDQFMPPLTGKDSTGLNLKQYDSLKDAFNKYLSQATCAEKMLDAVQKDLNCLSGEMTGVAQSMAALSSRYSTYRQAAVTQLNAGDSYIRELKTQSDQITSWLGGDGTNGTPGLLAALKTAQGVSASTADEYSGPSGIKTTYDQLADQRKKLEEYIPVRVGGLARDCMQKQTKSKFICHVGDQASTFTDYLNCAIKESIKAGNASSGNPNDANAQQNADAVAKAGRASGILSGMFDKMPDKSTVPTKPEDFAAGADANYPIEDEPSALGLYQSEFEGIDSALSARAMAAWQRSTGYPSPSAFIEGIVHQCFNDAENQVAQERTQSKSTIGMAQKSITDAETQTRTRANSIIQKYDDALSDMAAAMQFGYARPDLKSCMNQAPATQEACMTSGSQAISDLLRGTNAHAAKTWTLPVGDATLARSFPSLTKAVTCSGLDGCVKALQLEAAHRTTLSTQAKKDRVKFIQNQNLALDNMIASTAQSYSPMVAQLSSHIDALNSALGMLQGTPIKKDFYTECKSPDYDQSNDMEPSQELEKAPQDFVGAIGCRTNPALKLDGSMFGDAAASIGTVGNTVAGSKSSIEGLLSSLDAKKAECTSARQNALTDAVDDLGQCWGTAVCGDTSDQSPSTKAVGDWNLIATALGVSRSTGESTDPSLDHGMWPNYCTPPSEATEPNDFCKINTKNHRFDTFNTSGATKRETDNDSKCVPNDANQICAKTIERERQECSDATKALADAVRNNQSGCGKKFSGAVGKAKIVKGINKNSDVESSDSAE